MASKKKPLNDSLGKGTAIITIEGISMSIEIWHRRMAAEIETWDQDRLQRLQRLLDPFRKVAEQADRLTADK